MTVAELPELFAPSRDAVLTKAQVAQALQISQRQVDRLNLPCVTMGARTVRFVWSQVLETLQRRAR